MLSGVVAHIGRVRDVILDRFAKEFNSDVDFHAFRGSLVYVAYNRLGLPAFFLAPLRREVFLVVGERVSGRCRCREVAVVESKGRTIISLLSKIQTGSFG